MSANNFSSRFKNIYNNIHLRICKYIQDSDVSSLIILALLVGIVGGVAAAVFHHLISIIKNIFFGVDAGINFVPVIRSLPWYHRILSPVIGGLIVGPLIYFFVPEAKGHGVPEVMEAAALNSGKIRARVAPFKALISAITIGSGGSAGREGPIVQIGAGFGSALGQFFKLDGDSIEILLASGAAAGISGTFNAPLAGVIFSLEVIMKNIKLKNFSPVVIASLTGNAVANLFFGPRQAIFNIPTHNFVSNWEFFFYIGLGLFAAVVALIYQNSLYGMEHLFEGIKFPPYLKPALGGLLIALLALRIPEIHSTGYPIMEQALNGTLPLYLTLIFMIAKILATDFTLGSGASGGIFAPSLFIGAMAGSSYGGIINTFFPNITGGPGSYAIIGMGAVFAGAAHAPLTSIVILFEMTRDFKIFLPMMLACIVSSVATGKVQKKNIYTTKLLNRGIDLSVIDQANLIKNIKVKEIMSSNPLTLYDTNTVADAKKLFKGAFVSYVPVLKQKSGDYIGMMSYRNLMNFIEKNENIDDLGSKKIENLVFPTSNKIHTEDSIIKALEIISNTKSKTLPVFSNDDEKLVGVVSRSDILDAYHKKITRGDKENLFTLSDKETLEVKNLINFAVDSVSKTAEDKNIIIEKKLDDNLPEIIVNSNKILWVLNSLLSNSIQYTVNGGVIKIHAYNEGEKVLISIKDQGGGIPEHIQLEVFNKYSSMITKDNINGDDLPLSSSKEIISAHNGDLWVEESSQSGTTFILSLDAYFDEDE
ncbi:chloride channel protein [Halanaerobium hydrogeniformans]|uniref:Multi-sensor signal transduction histidine kinase n=1 Tax=Halanaerobium hydrogeniformans TaxID=656519 RepID=E4RKH9_HALHG|nr:chloride channel protein [Halanaerobium hydrogeniformans]ADQ14688.1 multi-sensor signal transduction histidine kinase [Halanaerobium hydrogeniformans]